MATRAQKKSQKAQKRVKKLQQKKKQQGTSPIKRLASKLAKQEPHAWAEETVEDVAIFEDDVLASLSVEGQEHARLIREGLQQVCSRWGSCALEALTVISRRSPFADWRIFLKGLVDWLNDDLTSATEAWALLNKERRPARIAMSLILSHRDDLTELEKSQAAATAQQGWFGKIDADLVYHAKLVRRFQIDRVAIRAASAITRIPMMDKKSLVNPLHIDWLRDFTTEHRALEPELVQALHEVTILRAYCGPFVDMFEDAVKYFRGPRHDRKNTLLRYFDEMNGDNFKNADTLLDRYLNEDVPNNPDLSPQLRNAIVSNVHVILAAEELRPKSPFSGGMFSFFDDGPDMKVVKKHFEAAVRAYPENRMAWTGYQASQMDLLDNSRLKKAEIDKIHKEIAKLQSRWIQALPEDLEPRMALVDYLLDNDRSNEAKEHVEWLAGTRRDNPLADAMGWKWNLLEAMRLCRRKAWAAKAVDFIDRAAEVWPKWVAADWLPYLKAGVALRGGDSSVMDAIPPVDGSSTDITGACMMLGAAQRMQIPSPDLKPLRKPVDDGVSNLSQLSYDDLLRFASFYWDLHRTNLRYPALRMHGNKFLGELLERFHAKPKLVTEQWDNPLIRSALLIMATEGMFIQGYDVRVPNWLSYKDRDAHPAILATIAVSVDKRRSNWGLDKFAHILAPLRKAATTSDLFYRHFYTQLADDLDERFSERGLGGSKIAEMFARYNIDPDLVDFDDDDDDDGECECDDCRAARGELV